MSQRCLWLIAIVIGCSPKASTLVRVDAEMPGPNCQFGGLAVSTGVDHNHDGTLGDTEITSTQYVCNGGSVVRCAPTDVVHSGSVTIRDAADFAQLDGVTCLDGGLIVAGLTGEMASLPALHTVTGGVIVAGNDDITTLGGFAALREIGQTYLIQGNAALQDIASVAKIEKADSIQLVGNDSLVDLAGLSTLDTLPCSLGVSNNPALASLHGLENIVTTPYSLTFSGNGGLTDLSALQNLRSAAALEINSNASLHAVALPKLQQLDVRLIIMDNPTLMSVSAPDLIAMSDGFLLDGNPRLTSVSLPSLLTTGVARFENDTLLASIDAHSLAYVTADLTFTNLSSLTGANFTGLKAVGGTFRVYGDTTFSFSGFTNLGEVGTLWVVNTSSMTDFGGLTALTKIDGDMTVSSCPQLSSFAGLDSMATIGGNVTILDNASLSHATVQAFLAGVSVAGTTTVQ